MNKRQLNSNQIALRLLFLTLKGASGTLTVEGFDSAQVSVSRASAGLYTITIPKGFQGELKTQVAGHAFKTLNRQLVVTASDYSVITIQVSDLAGAAADADLDISLVGSDHRFIQ